MPAAALKPDIAELLRKASGVHTTLMKGSDTITGVKAVERGGGRMGGVQE